MKRFYKTVTTSQNTGLYKILLDGRTVKTPEKQELATKYKGLADSIMKEWAKQEENILPEAMPLTQILTTKIDRVEFQRPEMTERLLKYLDTDLVCYRADHPPEIAERQALHGDPALVWFEKKFGVALKTTITLNALAQPKEAHAKVFDFINTINHDKFTILQLVTSLSGSLILSLMFLEGDLNAVAIFNASHAEESYHAEIYNEEKYGPDPIQGKKDEAVKRDLAAAEEYLSFISN